MEYWVIMESGHCRGLVVAPADWDERKVFAEWLRQQFDRVHEDGFAEKWQIETLKE